MCLGRAHCGPILARERRFRIRGALRRMHGKRAGLGARTCASAPNFSVILISALPAVPVKPPTMLTDTYHVPGFARLFRVGDSPSEFAV